MARLARFGVDLDAIAQHAIDHDVRMGRVRRSIRETIGTAYARLDRDALQALVNDWGVSYVVFDRAGFGDVEFVDRPLPVAMSNDHFVVYALPPADENEPTETP